MFDAYGTLFDVHAAAAEYAERLGPKWQVLSELWRTKQLEYTWIHASAGVHDSFWNLTVQALDFSIQSIGGVDDQLREGLLSAYRTLGAYPEVADVLSQLKDQGHQTAILSNGDADMLSDAVNSAGLSSRLDRVLSVEEVGVFKPDMKVYQAATDQFGVAPEEISFQSSNRWDIAGAAIFGFDCVWVNRAGKPDEYPNAKPSRTIKDLTELV